MLKWALIFALISVIAGIAGFTGIAAGASTVAQMLFYVCAALFVLFLLLGLFVNK